METKSQNYFSHKWNYTSVSASSSARFPQNCSASPNKKYCMCSPSKNPGAFRCLAHRSSGDQLPSHKPIQSLAHRNSGNQLPSTTSAFPSTSISASQPASSSALFPRDCSASPHGGHKVGGRILSRLPNKKNCMCSPSKSPGAFRCSAHRSSGDQPPSHKPSQSLNFRRSVMIKLMMKSGGYEEEEEGEVMRRVRNADLIRRSSLNRPQQRRLDFKHRPTRFHVARQGVDGEEN